MPAGNTGTWQLVGYSINLGGGWNFNKWLGVLAEYSFNSANIPQSTLTNVGEPNGNVHVWSLTLDPIVYYKTSGHIGGYVTGGGGFYRKLTSFTEPVYVGTIATTSTAAIRSTRTSRSAISPATRAA